MFSGAVTAGIATSTSVRAMDWPPGDTYSIREGCIGRKRRFQLTQHFSIRIDGQRNRALARRVLNRNTALLKRALNLSGFILIDFSALILNDARLF
jgi:hypothetical protein